MAETESPLREERFRRELEALAHVDTRARPRGWKLSPRAVSDFIIGLEEPIAHPDGDSVAVGRKFYGDDALVERAVVTLTSARGLILIGEPGTAKTMLSELFSAAIGGSSTLTIQGSAATTEDQIKYGWNYALLLDRGPCPEALVAGPLLRGMREGKLVRFEEITRCGAEVQDALVSPLSDRVMAIPELGETVIAARGFNVIATANTRDRGVNDMSAALKRRFNFETVTPLRDRALEIALVEKEVARELADAGIAGGLHSDVSTLLVTVFQELRAGISDDGDRLERPSTVLSTAEAVAVGATAALHAHHYRGGAATPATLVEHLVGTVLKDEPDDARCVRDYFARVARRRAESSEAWKAFYEARERI